MLRIAWVWAGNGQCVGNVVHPAMFACVYTCFMLTKKQNGALIRIYKPSQVGKWFRLYQELRWFMILSGWLFYCRWLCSNKILVSIDHVSWFFWLLTTFHPETVITISTTINQLSPSTPVSLITTSRPSRPLNSHQIHHWTTLKFTTSQPLSPLCGGLGLQSHAALAGQIQEVVRSRLPSWLELWCSEKCFMDG